jgi:hypothetical protein
VSDDGVRPPDTGHARPSGADDATVEAVGTLSEALEWVERARGRLYDLHQMIGHADFLLDTAAEQLDSAGHGDAARRLREDLIGRNVLDGRWTFQVVEEFDRLYYEPFRDVERQIRDEHMAGRRHVFEAELKEKRRTRGRSGHESRPPAAAGPEAVTASEPGS